MTQSFPTFCLRLTGCCASLYFYSMGKYSQGLHNIKSLCFFLLYFPLACDIMGSLEGDDNLNSSELPPWNYALSYESQDIIRAYFSNLKPFAKQTCDNIRQVSDIISNSPEIQDSLKLCQQFNSTLNNSEELKKAQEIATCIAEQLNTPEFKATMAALAEAAQRILDDSIEAWKQFQEDNLIISQETPAVPVTESAVADLDWFGQLLPIDMRGIWLDIDDKTGLIASALTMSRILLPRLVECVDAGVVTDGMDAVIFSVYFVVFLNMLVRAYSKRIDQIRNNH